MAMIGGMTGVLHDVIPYGLSTGNRNTLQGINLIGLRRAKFDNKDIINNTKQAEVIRIISDNSKLKNTLKYKIKFNINETISDLIKIYDV